MTIGTYEIERAARLSAAKELGQRIDRMVADSVRLGGVGRTARRFGLERSTVRAVARAAGLIGFAALLASCSKQELASISTGGTCEAFKPIDYSRKDTKATVTQIREHNAVGQVICDWAK